MSKYHTSSKEVIDLMISMKDEQRALKDMRFFKTGKGDYGEGDKFLGITNPQVRNIVKQVGSMLLDDIHIMIMSEWHEVRLCGLLILVAQFEKLCKKKLCNDFDAISKRDEMVLFYLEHAERANNWDLVDLSASNIIGAWLLLPTMIGSKDSTPSINKSHKLKTLDKFAHSKNLWKQRISIVCSWQTSRLGEPFWCLRYAEIHLLHPHDLMHKAVGWMLREMGKKCSMDLLRDFLEKHVHEMARTTLRYAIEKMPEEERQMWLNK